MRRHLRRFLLVKNEAGARCRFRFYDQRVLRAFLPSCTPEETVHFFGPLQRICIPNGAAPHMLLAYPGHPAPDILLWTAADAALQPDARILEGFGMGGLMSAQKLDEINRGRSLDEQRSPAECLAPFDVDAQGTVVGNGGSGVIVTTLEFALRHALDITSIIVGWGQSGEAGGKAHLAGP